MMRLPRSEKIIASTTPSCASRCNCDNLSVKREQNCNLCSVKWVQFAAASKVFTSARIQVSLLSLLKLSSFPPRHLPTQFVVFKNKLQNLLNPKELLHVPSGIVAVHTDEEKHWTTKWNFQIIHRFHSLFAVNMKMFEFQLQFSMIYFLFSPILPLLRYFANVWLRWLEHVKVFEVCKFHFSFSCRSRLPNFSSTTKK